MARPMRAAAAMLALLALAPPSAAQPAESPLAWLIGEWRGAGTRLGTATEARLELRLALGGRFVELRYVSSGFEGRAFYRRIEGGGWRGEWFDNRGMHLGIDAEVVPNVLTANWGSSATERGRTVYRLLDDGRLEVVDSVAGHDGIQREFARHLLTRGG